MWEGLTERGEKQMKRKNKKKALKYVHFGVVLVERCVNKII